MSAGTKRSTIFQEAIRRLRNVSPELSWWEAVPHMDTFSNMLRLSGYSQPHRRNVIKGAIERMIEIRNNVKSGKWKSQYRNRIEISKAKLAKGGNSASTWFLKGDATSRVTCATLNSELQKVIKENLSIEKRADGGKN